MKVERSKSVGEVCTLLNALLVEDVIHSRTSVFILYCPMPCSLLRSTSWMLQGRSSANSFCLQLIAAKERFPFRPSPVRYVMVSSLLVMPTAHWFHSLSVNNTRAIVVWLLWNAWKHSDNVTRVSSSESKSNHWVIQKAGIVGFTGNKISSAQCGKMAMEGRKTAVVGACVPQWTAALFREFPTSGLTAVSQRFLW